MKKLIINDIKEKESLFHYIKRTFPNMPIAVFHKTLRNKDIKLNGKRNVSKDDILRNGDILEIYISDFILYGFPKTLNIAYEDDNILVAYKPQGILSNDETENILEPTFEDFVKEYYNDVTICHRLDRNTAGLIIFAKNKASLNCILEAFKAGNITKEYIAYVSGTDFLRKHFTLEKYLLKDEKNGFCKVYDNEVLHSQKIITEFIVEKTDKRNNYSILRIILHTGRTHQIRAQLLNISHPIIGDSKYGKNEINKKYNIYKQLLFAVKYSFNFPKNCLLYYLNELTITLDNNLFEKTLYIN